MLLFLPAPECAIAHEKGQQPVEQLGAESFCPLAHAKADSDFSSFLPPHSGHVALFASPEAVNCSDFLPQSAQVNVYRGIFISPYGLERLVSRT